MNPCSKINAWKSTSPYICRCLDYACILIIWLFFGLFSIIDTESVGINRTKAVQKNTAMKRKGRKRKPRSTSHPDLGRVMDGWMEEMDEIDQENGMQMMLVTFH